MRTTKLTLSADKALVKEAKTLAGASGTSLSSMVSRYLAAVLGRRRHAAATGPVTRRATGLVRLPAGRSDRELLSEALSARHRPSR